MILRLFLPLVLLTAFSLPSSARDFENAYAVYAAGAEPCKHYTIAVKKGGRTPTEAGMRLVQHPVKPRRSPVINISLSIPKYKSWQQFLDHAYWNVELK